MSRLTSWLDRTRIVYIGLALVLAAVGWRLSASQGAAPSDPAGGSPRVEVRVAAPPPAPPVVVHVAGAVRRPGVYVMPDGSRTGDAVRRAGGPTRRGDPGALNLAAPLTDGQQVLVPDRAARAGGTGGAGARPGGSAAAPAVAAGPVSLSRATPEQLEALDGIGPALAARIVEWRDRNGPFATVDDLLEVPGIGEARLEALRDEVVP